MDKTLLSFGRKKLTDETAVAVLTVSVFLPFALTIAAAVLLFIALIVNSRTRRAVFVRKGAWLLYAFCSLAAISSAVFGNLLGIVCTFGILLAVADGIYMYTVMTRELFDRIIKYIFRIIPVVTAAALIELAYRIYTVVICDTKIRFMTRCTCFFFNPNYFGTVAAITALICIYRFIITREKRIWPVLAGVCSLACLIMSQSLFACVELLVGAIVLLSFSQKWKYLAILTVCLLAAAAAVVVFPQLVPRLTEASETFDLRLRVWGVAVKAIKQSPFIGQGPLTYDHLFGHYTGIYEGITVWRTQHAHNLVLDTLLSYGVIGAVLFWWYVGRLTAVVGRELRDGGDSRVTGLVAAVAIAALLHGMIDITLMWIQTGLLFMFIISAAGALKKEKEKTV